MGLTFFHLQSQLHPLAEIQGVGGYVSVWKTIPVLLVLLVWARLLTWADKDAPAAHLPRVPLNVSFLGGLILAFALFFFLPNFFLALDVVVLVFAVEAGVYLTLRHKRVDLADLQKQ